MRRESISAISSPLEVQSTPPLFKVLHIFRSAALILILLLERYKEVASKWYWGDNLDFKSIIFNRRVIYSKDKKIFADDRCSFHVHFDVQDCLFYDNKIVDFSKSKDLASILAWWIKCEAVFFDSSPDSRKLNKYCQCIGLSDIFNIEEEISTIKLIEKLSDKYFSINVFHLRKNIRPTIEFRLADCSACLDSDFANNWILFLDNFIEKAISSGNPDSLTWLDPKDFFNFIDINNSKIRDWFLGRIFTNINSDISCWKFLRKNSILEFQEILNNLQLDKDFCSYSGQKYK
jgi:hypothetical protein